jgi:hypothetical protein
MIVAVFASAPKGKRFRSNILKVSLRMVRCSGGQNCSGRTS